LQRLTQVLHNLLTNALRHTTEGGITLSANRLAGEGSGKAQVCFAVIDTGEGVPPDDLPHVFTRATGRADPAAAAWAWRLQKRGWRRWAARSV
jgi:K+-sensing histidine kinase KdpD